jgi:hypothetical protein
MNQLSPVDSRLRRLGKAYYIAKSVVINEGFAAEIDWQYAASLDQLNEQTFLCEAAWVILNSGMRESVVRKKFSGVSQAFFDWRSSVLIVTNENDCRTEALRHFCHTGKVEAILTVAKHLNAIGINEITEQLSKHGPAYLQKFPFVGPTTSLHLAKNIGFSVAKPDRHLCRIADSFGYDGVQKLCEDIARVTDEPVQVIDVVLWRYATKHQQEIMRFSKLVNKALCNY